MKIYIQELFRKNLQLKISVWHSVINNNMFSTNGEGCPIFPPLVEKLWINRGELYHPVS